MEKKWERTIAQSLGNELQRLTLPCAIAQVLIYPQRFNPALTFCGSVQNEVDVPNLVGKCGQTRLGERDGALKHRKRRFPKRSQKSWNPKWDPVHQNQRCLGTLMFPSLNFVQIVCAGNSEYAWVKEICDQQLPFRIHQAPIKLLHLSSKNENCSKAEICRNTNNESQFPRKHFQNR